MVIWTLARKDMRLLIRDRRAVTILLIMPLLFIGVLGLSLGEGFGQKPDNRLRVTILDLDEGFVGMEPVRIGLGPADKWSKLVERDLDQTAGIRVERLTSLEQAERLVGDGRLAAVLVFGPEFSRRVSRCSFLADGINPFYRDGVKIDELDARLLRDETQLTAAAIIEQVEQVSLLRVILPWMIGRAFEKLGDPAFMRLLGNEVPGYLLLPMSVKEALGAGVQNALKRLFPKYNLTGKTWASLTKSDPRSGGGAGVSTYVEEEGGLLKRGAQRYQILVPSYMVMFAFFLVLTVGWLFVAERRQGTLKRLRAAPLSRGQLLLGKLLPSFGLSLFQGLFLLVAAKIVFGMSWGAQPLWLVAVVVATSLAAMGMALLVASVARTETQVAIYGTLLVLVLAGVSGCLMGDRELMPSAMQEISLLTPHAWALTAYKQLLTAATPNLALVAQACGVLACFGLGFIGLSWAVLRLD
jgi:ABC-type Na+ efflux pump permease subunit